MIHRRQQYGAAGFSLIEVMVATAVLLVVVLMLGSVFRQASSAWDSGYARAEGGMVVRGVLGSIHRELSHAVDGRHFPGAWSDSYMDVPVYVSDNTLAFIRPEFNYIPPRSEQQSEEEIEKQKEQYLLVTYTVGSGEVTRKWERLVWHASTSNPPGYWSTSGGKSSEIYKDDMRHGYGFESEFKFFADTKPEPDLDVLHDEAGQHREGFFWTVPTVSVRVTFTRKGKFSGLRVRSVGRDGEEDTDDDVVIR